MSKSVLLYAVVAAAPYAPPSGHVAEFQIRSKVYGRDRRVWVYTPPAYRASGADSYGLVVAFDGYDYRDSIPLPAILDSLAAAHKAPQSPTAVSASLGRGENTSTKSRPFTRAEKLETQNGIRNKRKICQRPSFTCPAPEAVVLMYSARPMMRLKPRDVSHKRGLGSKYRASTTPYQMK